MVLNVKGATRPHLEPDGSPGFVKKSVDHCLEMLGGRGRIDMFECARRDPNVPLEQTLGALAELVNESKIGGVALSEVSTILSEKQPRSRISWRLRLRYPSGLQSL